MRTSLTIMTLAVGLAFGATAQEPAASGVETASVDVPVMAATNPPAAGALTFGAGLGDDLQVYSLDVMAPLWRTERTALWFNPRGALLESEDQEINAGLVWRRLCGRHDAILGMNAYYDARRTEADHTLQQVGGGLELLTRWVDLRANYYHPLDDSPESIGGREETVTSRVGSRRITTTTVYRETEEAMQGFDAEIGVWLPYVSRVVPTGLFVGYYDFETDDGGLSVDGVEARVECRPHPNLTLDCSWFSEEEYRRSSVVVGVRLHFPLDAWNGLRRHRGQGRVPPFAARMAEPVQRDFRLRVATAVSETSSRRFTTTPVSRGVSEPEPVCRQVTRLTEEGEIVIETICE